MKKKMKNEISDDEINLIELLSIAWDGKFKILVAVLISTLSFMFYTSDQKKNFIAVTKIKPISSIEENKYTAFNSYNYISINDIINPKSITTEETNIIINNVNEDNIENFNKGSNFTDLKTFKLTASELLKHYVAILNERSLFVDGIRKYKLLDVNEYNDAGDYEEAINQLAAKIKIISKVIPEKKKIQEGVEVTYTTIQFEFHDVKKWKLVLAYVDEEANKIVKKSLNDQYQRLILAQKQERDFILEDLSEKIDNLIIDYDRQARNRILFLEEQSEIAKQLDVAKNTIEIQTIQSNQSTLLSPINTDTPYYLRGYDAIDKEIELIKSRTDKNAFIKGLDKTIEIKRKFQQDKNLERAESIFKRTPFGKDENFYAATIKVLSTKFEYKNNRIMIIISAVVGFIVGLFFVLISNAIRVQKNS